MSQNKTIPVAVVMGSKSDWPTMSLAVKILTSFGIKVHKQVISAHRTPKHMVSFAEQAVQQGFEVIIAGAGGAAHLPGMIAANTVLPVLGVPVKSKALNGLDSLLSIVQMPAGVPVGTLAIGEAGAKNAAYLALAILANTRPKLRVALEKFREAEVRRVVKERL